MEKKWKLNKETRLSFSNSAIRVHANQQVATALNKSQ